MNAQSELTEGVKCLLRRPSSASSGIPELLTQLYGDTVFPPMRKLYCFLALPPTMGCLQVHIGSFPGGIWCVAVSGERGGGDCARSFL